MSATMFKAIFWKELRQHLKWAVFVLATMAIVLAIATRMLQGGSAVLSRIAASLDATMTIGAALAGLLIGAVQVIGENRGDRWGFLAHRPASRTTLFCGKAAAGIVLYAISTGLPFAAALSWMAAPPYLPVPFDWRLALPGISSILVGLVFYFAGMLTAMREGRWYASRALGIGAAFWCLVLQMIVQEFWQAAAATAAGLVIVGTAAWSTFVAGGQYGAQPIVGRMATGVSIGLGLTLVGFTVYAFSAFQVGLFGGPIQQAFRATHVVITDEGAAIRIMNDHTGFLEASHMDGRPLELSPEERLGRFPRAIMVNIPTAARVPPSFRSTERLFSPLSSPLASSGSVSMRWYYVHRLGLLSAFDSESGRLIGWMGPDGFSPGEARPRPFTGSLRNQLSQYASSPFFLVHDDAVHRVNLRERRIERLFQPEPTELPVAAGSTEYNAATLERLGEMAAFEVIATTQRVVIQAWDGTKLLEMPIDAQAARYSSLQVYRALRGPGIPTFLGYQEKTGELGRISEFDSAGALVNTWTLQPTIRPFRNSRLQVAISSAITPVIGQAFMEVAARKQRAQSSRSTPPQTTYWAIAIVSSLVFAAAALVRGRRYAFPPARLGTWTGLALLLGPLGFLMMLALLEWPALEPCPACRKRRVVTRERCEHCGEPFASPPEDGTEIFEPVR